MLVVTGVAQAAPISAQDKDTLKAVAAEAPDTPYSNYGFAYPDPDWVKYGDMKRENFARGTKVGDLVDKEGNLLLFRNIGGPYVKGFVGERGKNFIERENNAYSYSLAPTNTTAMTDKSDVYTLISIQNIDEDGLMTWMSPKPGGQYSYLVPANRSTSIQDIAYYDEIKVPVAKENVVAIIRQSEFKKIVDEFGNKTFRLKDFIEKLLKDPGLEGVPPQVVPPEKISTLQGHASCPELFGHLK